MIEKMIVDADLCIKLGGSSKYKYLYDILPLVSKNIYKHTQAHSEVMMPVASVSQLRALVSEGKVLAYAKAVGIPVFATDEMNLQPIINTQLNAGIDDITCLRIVDIIKMAKEGEVNISRKVAKALWLVAGKKKETFDTDIWPIQ